MDWKISTDECTGTVLTMSGTSAPTASVSYIARWDSSWNAVTNHDEIIIGGAFCRGGDYSEKPKACPHCHTNGGEDKYHLGTCANCGAPL